MSTTSIGFISFRSNLREALVPMRLRALQAEAALQGAVFVILDWSDFDEVNGRILTWSLTSAGWKSERRQVPDVVIIVGAPVTEQQIRLIDWVRKTRSHIHDVGINKTDLVTCFKNTAAEKYLIPDTKIPKIGSAETIAEFLTAHGSAVIKRSDANRGVGLVFVFEKESGWCISDNQSKVLTLTKMVDEIVSRIKGRLAYRDFVIQKYIRSVAADGRAADIRVHVQRGYDQTWGITRAYVRLAEVGSMKTNISCGGYQGPLMGFLEFRTNRSALDIKTEIYEAAIQIAEIQSAAAVRPLSELGIDLLLDNEDKIWLVETNAMPQSSLHEQERAINTIGYALSLVGANRKY